MPRTKKNSPAKNPPRSAAGRWKQSLRAAVVAIKTNNTAAAARAILELHPDQMLSQFLPVFAANSLQNSKIFAQGFPASPGAVSGKLAFSSQEVFSRTLRGESVILVRKETTADDMEAIARAAGVLTTTGGMTSHAALVARGWGKPCVTGVSALHVDPRQRTLRLDKKILRETDTISLDGGTGSLWLGNVKVTHPRFGSDLQRVLDWASSRAKLRVLANADTPDEARLARKLGACGIGLCRTEHMFFQADRIADLRAMILAHEPPARDRAIHQLMEYQRADFLGIFKAMDGLPVTVRLLDPPLHEFLPRLDDRENLKLLSEKLAIPVARIRQRIEQLREVNPMLGRRGCRLSITFPALLTMQVTALVEALIQAQRQGIAALPRILHPMVSDPDELALLCKLSNQAIDNVCKASRYTKSLHIPLGTMIEVPRAALLADKLAQHVDFFCIGTNDLTQMTFGMSRDDVIAFLPGYRANGLFPTDPFATLDEQGVGRLIRIALELGRKTKPTLHVGVCGEHGGDPASISLLEKMGVDEVSCSPLRVPTARLAAGQTTLRS